MLPGTLVAWLVLAAGPTSPNAYVAGVWLVAQGQPAPSFRRYEKKPPHLSEAEAARIRSEVLTRCKLPQDSKAKDAPWYFHYELGLELAERGDAQRALDALIDSVDRRPEPQRKARLYGMWFLDYLPYLQIARAHAHLGNRECAMDALRLSEQLGEVTPDDRDAKELEALLGDLKN